MKVSIPSASSLPHKLTEQVFIIPGLSLKTNSEIAKKIVQNVLNSELKDKNDVVCWHDVIDNSISSHNSKIFHFRSVPEILAILKQLKNRLEFYCTARAIES